VKGKELKLISLFREKELYSGEEGCWVVEEDRNLRRVDTYLV
jgi:hypothetical protein